VGILGRHEPVNERPDIVVRRRWAPTDGAEQNQQHRDREPS
jgi:hypothetical protein